MPGFQELLVILVVAVVVIGPRRLPRVAGDVARLLVRFRREARSALSDFRAAAEAEGLDRELRDLRREVRDTHDSARRSLRRSLSAGDDGQVDPGSPDAETSPGPGSD